MSEDVAERPHLPNAITRPAHLDPRQCPEGSAVGDQITTFVSGGVNVAI